MKKSWTVNREQRAMEQLIRQALPPIGEARGNTQDLWPAMQRRLRRESVAKALPVHVPWFDFALAGGLALLVAAFPAWIPVLLYYL